MSTKEWHSGVTSSRVKVRELKKDSFLENVTFKYVVYYYQLCVYNFSNNFVVLVKMWIAVLCLLKLSVSPVFKQCDHSFSCIHFPRNYRRDGVSRCHRLLRQTLQLWCIRNIPCHSYQTEELGQSWTSVLCAHREFLASPGISVTILFRCFLCSFCKSPA